MSPADVAAVVNDPEHRKAVEQEQLRLRRQHAVQVGLREEAAYARAMRELQRAAKEETRIRCTVPGERTRAA